MNGKGEPKLIYPALAGFYASVSDLWYPMIRVASGAILFMHGWAKLNAGPAGITAYMAKSGYEPASAFAYSAMFLETVGAVCIMVGLLTRPFAAAIAIEMAILTFIHHWGNGFAWTRPGGGFEYPLLWGIVMFAIALRGGGSYSLDRAIGKEV